MSRRQTDRAFAFTQALLGLLFVAMCVVCALSATGVLHS